MKLRKSDLEIKPYRKLNQHQCARLASAANDQQRRPITLVRLKCLQPEPEDIPAFLPRRRP